MSLFTRFNQNGNPPLLLRIFLPLLFIIASVFYITTLHPSEFSYLLIFATIAAAYMAMNIGANDMANNVAPAVGSYAMTMIGAILIAVIAEALGALLAGSTVIGTFKSGIIDPNQVANTNEYIWLMASALVAAAVWLNLATWLGAPVSTTHSIVGGLLGAGVAAGGFAIANWSLLAAILASWIISPLLGGLIAAAILAFIKKTILYRQDHKQAAIRFVPILVGFTAWAFTAYLLVIGLKHLWKPSLNISYSLGLVAAIGSYLLTRSALKERAPQMENSIIAVNELFKIPLILAAALLSFAHGANDVANAVGPLTAIYEALYSSRTPNIAPAPMWIMIIGAAGICIGLALFGPKLVRTVGGEITDLDKSRAYCIAMSTAITVIAASQIGMPVSATHIALGSVFGVGFLREYLKTRYASQLHRFLVHHKGEDRIKLQQFLDDFKKADEETMHTMLATAKQKPELVPLQKLERKRLKKLYQSELVKRRIVYRIALAWAVTIPASAALAAIFYFILRGALLKV